MSTAPNLTETLLHQINHGKAEEALGTINGLLDALPHDVALLTLKAEALRMSGRFTEAIAAYKRAGAAGSGTRNWLVAAVLLVNERQFDEAMTSLSHAFEEDPENDEVLHTIVTTLFNANRYREGVEYARRLIAVSTNAEFLSDAALLLQSNDHYDEATDVFKRIVKPEGTSPRLLGAALVPARFTCEWEWIESLQQRISAHYAVAEYGATQEYPLTHLTWCTNEAYNLEVTKAYVARVLPAAAERRSNKNKAKPAARIRVGYLSSDFCNHATMHLMVGLLERHDRNRFEVFAYDSSPPDVSLYRQRFLRSVEHHVDITALTDAAAAARIEKDDLDILFDLKGHTGWGRLGVMAYRPAPLQAAYIGFPGSTGTDFIDYIVSDRFVTPDSSAPNYSEKFCRLPHSYQCNDSKRPVAGDAGTRAAHGLPENAVVFCAFNQSYKIDRHSFQTWLRVLKAVPDSVLWLLAQGPAAERNLRAFAHSAGVSPERLVFSEFVAPERHLARMQLADAALDALVCNGHTTTSDMLWAGIPVVTAKGHHFASRVSESLLNAMNLPELVGDDADAMVAIAQRIGTDALYRSELRTKVEAGRQAAPLFDTERFTRNFETSISMMVEAHRSGAPLQHIDVPDVGSFSACSSLPRHEGMLPPKPALKINLGCGSDYMQGWLNIDQWPEANPDMVMNLEQFPWKLEDNCADEILLKHVLAHIGQSNDVFLGIFQELYRICAPDALVRISVSHPRHHDFLADPTHVRPILPALFSCFDLATVETWQENRLPGTPLAKYLKVDFEMVSSQHHLTPYWQNEYAEGRLDEAGLTHAIESYNNVVQWTDITLRVRKPFRPGHALRRFDAICLERQGGMGDLLMTLGAAKVMKALFDRPVIVATAPQFRSLVEACPHVDYMVDKVETLSEQYGNVKHVDLGPAAYPLSRAHQIDAYLQAFGVSAEAELKSIDLLTNQAAEDEVDRLLSAWSDPAPDCARILLHAGHKDPNRSWPRERWNELALALIELGHQVIEIGANSDCDAQHGETPEGLLSAVNALSTLGAVALMRRSDILVAADSGPVHLAGASDIGIVGLFSAVAGSCRLPFRHGIAEWNAVEVKPTCGFHPCYQQMHRAEVIAPYLEKIRNQTLGVNELFAQWCPDGGSFSCMQEQISVQMVMDAIGRLDSSVVAARELSD